jgi:hypothetical protein
MFEIARSQNALFQVSQIIEFKFFLVIIHFIVALPLVTTITMVRATND